MKDILEKLEDRAEAGVVENEGPHSVSILVRAAAFEIKSLREQVNGLVGRLALASKNLDDLSSSVDDVKSALNRQISPNATESDQ